MWSRFVSDLWGTLVLCFFSFRVTFRAGLLFGHGKIQCWLFSLVSIGVYVRGPGNSVGIATAYGLDGPGIGSRWGGEIFRTRPDRL